MSALDDLKAADARIAGLAKNAVSTIASLRDENTSLRNQVSDLNARLANVSTDADLATVAADLNAGSDALDVVVNKQ